MNAPEHQPVGLALLRVPFEARHISKLPKPYKKDSPKGKCNECGGYHGLPALHLDYVGHAALTDRLLDADPNWTWEPLALDAKGLPAIDGNGGMWIKLTVCGVTRLGYGDAQDKQGANAVKECIGDALRNAAMRFGAALDLWHKGDLHGEEETEKREKGKKGQSAAAGSDERVANDRLEPLARVYSSIIDYMAADQPEEAAKAFYALTDADEMAYVWKDIDSAMRRKIKATETSKKRGENTQSEGIVK